MRVFASGMLLNVADPGASADFMIDHLGFEEKLHGDFFYVVSPPYDDLNVVFLAPGEPQFAPTFATAEAGAGVAIFLVVADTGAEYDRLRDEGVEIVTPIRTVYWADVIERVFQVRDPNGVIVNLSEWL